MSTDAKEEILNRISAVCAHLPDEVLIPQMCKLIARALPNTAHVLVMVDDNNDVTITSNIKSEVCAMLLRETAEKMEEGLEREDV